MRRLELVLSLYAELGVSVPYWNNEVCVGVTEHLGNQHLGQTNIWLPLCTAFFLQLTLLCFGVVLGLEDMWVWLSVA